MLKAFFVGFAIYLTIFLTAFSQNSYDSKDLIILSNSCIVGY